jgi:hypothetical protein
VLEFAWQLQEAEMPYSLEDGTQVRIVRKSAVQDGSDEEIWIGNKRISMEEFCLLVSHVFLGSDFSGDNDPRLKTFQLAMTRIAIGQGRAKGKRRLVVIPASTTDESLC